jgi:hypothetical protein
MVHPHYPNYRVLLRPLVIQGVLIPRGFVWDGCSIPGVARWLMGKPFDSDLADAGLLHDYLYETHKATRLKADQMFRKELLADGAGALRAEIMYAAVRAFSGSFYEIEVSWAKFIQEPQLTRWEQQANR